MEDPIVERMKADRGWLAKQMEKVPLFRGYLEHTTLWEADGLVRAEIARRIGALKDPVNDALRRAGGDVRQGDRIHDLESLTSQIDRLANRIRSARYGHGGIGAKAKVREQDLADLLAHDRLMFSEVVAAEGAAAALDQGTKPLRAALDALEHRFQLRHEMLVEVSEK